ncbi:hypothetical protein OAP14_09325, partial [Aliiglaciecola sp.]|nr:hypothetical protein [Aliiglaciecola sp.]
NIAFFKGERPHLPIARVHYQPANSSSFDLSGSLKVGGSNVLEDKARANRSAPLSSKLLRGAYSILAFVLFKH